MARLRTRVSQGEGIALELAKRIPQCVNFVFRPVIFPFHLFQHPNDQLQFVQDTAEFAANVFDLFHRLANGGRRATVCLFLTALTLAFSTFTAAIVISPVFVTSALRATVLGTSIFTTSIFGASIRGPPVFSASIFRALVVARPVF